jgi:predicted ATPase/class 3 adenylate cyclase
MAVLSLLVTDIVGSTRLWAEHEQEMAADLAAHDALVRRVVSAHGGSVFKHTGDGAMAAFDDPLDAVEAAVDLQRAIAAAHWGNPLGIRVRTAVHCGTVVERDGDLFGSPVNRAARIVELSPPGGVLVSSVAAGLLADRSLGDLRLSGVGRAQLRGFSHLESIVAVTGDGLAGAAPLGAGPDETTGGGSVLPPVDDELVGREVELEALWECLHGHHLVSVVGAGGMGKTRLAVEVAVGAPREFADGVWWCDLAAAMSAEAVLPVVLDALGARQEAGRTAMDAITSRLRDRTALVVLDNCEHVVDAVRDLVHAVRAGAPTVRLLLTSREAVGARGEQVVPISSLPAIDAADLFHARAGAAGMALDRTGDDEVIWRICARLDGIPLAIELAAARCRSLSPAEIDDRLGDRFRLLRSGRAGAERHRTLLAAVAWSFDLLDADERDVFDRLAVFADGSYIDGITAVTGLDEYDALDILDRLVARSMLTTSATPLGTRYRQLETLRQFAHDRLVERGLIEQVRDAQLAWACDFATWIGSAEGTAASGPAMRRYVAELDNLRLAVAHALSSGQPELAVTVVGGAWNMMICRPTHEVVGWFDPLALPVEWSVERALAVGLHAYLRFVNGEVGALAEAIRLVPATLHDVPAMISCRWTDLLWVQADQDGARAVLDTASTEHLGHSRVLDTCRVFTDLAAMLSGNLDPDFVARVQRDAAELVNDIRRVGDELALTAALSGYANSLINGGRADLAAAPAAEAVAIADELGAGWLADVAHGALARALAGTARADAARRPEIAKQLRRFILDAVERDTLQFALVIIDGVAAFVWEHDPRTAYVLAAIYRRAWAVSSLLPSEAVAGMDPAELAALDTRASITTDGEAIALALSALDRYLAAEPG